jgi:hypothetical protein
MKNLARAAVFALICVVPAFLTWASAILPIATDHHVQISAAVFRGAVLSVQSYRSPDDGHIYTRTTLRVDEVFKGKLPAMVKLVHRGGIVGNRGEMDGSAPDFKVGEERLLFVSQQADGALYATLGQASALKLTSGPPDSGSAPGQALLQELRNKTATGVIAGSDLAAQAPVAPEPSGGPVPLASPTSTATNLLVDTSGIGARFIVPDRGDPIPYVVDADYLPAGITLTQALTAVSTALSVWTNVTSVKYTFAGIQSFGMAAANVTNLDGVLRIQLHDHYNYIAGAGAGDTLGRGGHTYDTTILSTGWVAGGNVRGNDFYRSLNGFIVIENTNSFFTGSVSNLAEVLCHEIGHTIGLAHSSNNGGETNPILNQAAMFFEAHGGNRGAKLNSFDINTSNQINPATNPPPYNYNRFIDVVTVPTGPLNVAGVNQVQVRGYDLNHVNLSLATSDGTSYNGTFSNVGSNITYVPNAFYSASPRLDPGDTTSYYDQIFARYSDGTNASAWSDIRVISFSPDTYSEGIPDAWRSNYFGSTDPSAGPKRHAGDDYDGDGYSNLQEYLLGSDPTNRTSNLRITSIGTTNIQWQAEPYLLYELYAATNVSSHFTNWVRVINPIVPTNAPATATGFTNGGPRQFFRVEKVL